MMRANGVRVTLFSAWLAAAATAAGAQASGADDPRILTMRLASEGCLAQARLVGAPGGSALAPTLDALRAALDVRSGRAEPALLDEARALVADLAERVARLPEGEPAPRADFDRVLRLSGRLFVAAQALAEDEAAQGAGAGGLAAAALRDLHARQRVLARKLPRDLCLATWGDRGDGARLELAETVRVIDAAFTALHEGLPELGIAPPPTPAVESAVAAALDHWLTARPAAAAVAAGRDVAAGDLRAAVAAADAMALALDTAGAALSEALAAGL
jgi:hypothetical protein